MLSVLGNQFDVPPRVKKWKLRMTQTFQKVEMRHINTEAMILCSKSLYIDNTMVDVVGQRCLQVLDRKARVRTLARDAATPDEQCAMQSAEPAHIQSCSCSPPQHCDNEPH